MDFKVRISESALADFEEILEYSWINFPETSERFGHGLLDHVELLAKFPSIGRPVSGRPGIRQLVHAPILIYYQVHEDRGVGRSPSLLAWETPAALGIGGALVLALRGRA